MRPGSSPATPALALSPSSEAGLRPARARARAAVGLGVLVVGVLAPRTAAAYCRTNTCTQNDAGCTLVNGCPAGGNSVEWRRACVSFSVHEDASPALDLDLSAAEEFIGRALARWTGAECPRGGNPSIDIINLGPVSCDKVEYNHCEPNANSWIFRNWEWPHEGGGGDLGLTTVSFNVDTGELVDADVELNVPVIVRDYVDLGEVITHEAGHFLGLEHTPVADATMYYTPTFQNMNDLASDDIKAICAVYPPNKAAGACDPTPHAGFSKACGTDKKCMVKTGGCTAAPAQSGEAWTAFWIATLTGVVVAVRRRRSRPSAARVPPLPRG